MQFSQSLHHSRERKVFVFAHLRTGIVGEQLAFPTNGASFGISCLSNLSARTTSSNSKTRPHIPWRHVETGGVNLPVHVDIVPLHRYVRRSVGRVAKLTVPDSRKVRSYMCRFMFRTWIQAFRGTIANSSCRMLDRCTANIAPWSFSASSRPRWNACHSTPTRGKAWSTKATRRRESGFL